MVTTHQYSKLTDSVQGKFIPYEYFKYEEPLYDSINDSEVVPDNKERLNLDPSKPPPIAAQISTSQDAPTIKFWDLFQYGNTSVVIIHDLFLLPHIFRSSTQNYFGPFISKDRMSNLNRAIEYIPPQYHSTDSRRQSPDQKIAKKLSVAYGPFHLISDILGREVGGPILMNE